MTHKNQLLKILTLLAAVVVLNSNVFSYVALNGAGSGYVNNVNGNKGTIQETGDKTLEMYIFEGSGYYLGALGNINNILKLYEEQDLSGIDFYRLNRLIDKALIDMDKAITVYNTLILKAENTPYNKEVLDKLAGFDYYTFMTEKRLNKDIFQQVEGYLKAGYITGVFKHTYENLLSIRLLMVSIKSLASVNSLPAVDTIWQLNEKCLENSYFGSYVARVFNNLK
jgi:hypothetical protein